MPLDNFHRDALPPDKFSIGESNLGLISELGRLGGGGRDVGSGGVGVGGGLTLSDRDPLVEKYINFYTYILHFLH